jgi:hypothetical protein
MVREFEFGFLTTGNPYRKIGAREFRLQRRRYISGHRFFLFGGKKSQRS